MLGKVRAALVSLGWEGGILRAGHVDMAHRNTSEVARLVLARTVHEGR